MMRHLNFVLLCAFMLVSFTYADVANKDKIAAPKKKEIVAPKVQGKLNYKLDDYRNYFGAWCGGAGESLWFARNMGIRHIIYQNGMEKHPLAKGMNFYYVDPEFVAYKRVIDFSKKYSEKDIKKWRDFCAMKDASLPFPYCMATGWFFKFDSVNMKADNKSVCSLMPNLQKQKVIDEIIEKVMAKINHIQKINPDFKFAGFVWDVPQLEGDFWGFDTKKRWRKQCGMSFWRGVDSVSVPKGEKLDYPTYCEARVAYYRQIRKAGQKLNPNTKLIMDPAIIYGHYAKDYKRLGIKPKDPALADFVQLEFGTDEYLRDKQAWDTGYFQTENIANAVDYYCYDFDKELHAVGAIASLGGWSCWFGNPCPGQGRISDVPARMKLSRAIATWENLNNTPIEKRQWDLKKLTYNSPTAHISKNLLWATHPETKKIFFCFLSKAVKLQLPEGMDVDTIYPLNAVFAEYKPSHGKNKAKQCFKIEGDKLSIKDETQYVLGEAFSLTLKPKAKRSSEKYSPETPYTK